MFNTQVGKNSYTVKFSHNHSENDEGKLICASTWALFFVGSFLLDWQEIRCENGENLALDRRRKNALSKILCRQFDDRKMRKEFWDAYFNKQESDRNKNNRKSHNLIAKIWGTFQH